MVREIADEASLDAALRDAAQQLVVVDFFASWCGPCLQIAPFVEELQEKYPDVVFLKVNVDSNPAVAERYEISAMPTFIFIKNKTKIHEVVGANRAVLEDAVRRHSP